MMLARNRAVLVQANPFFGHTGMSLKYFEQTKSGKGNMTQNWRCRVTNDVGAKQSCAGPGRPFIRNLSWETSRTNKSDDHGHTDDRYDGDQNDADGRDGSEDLDHMLRPTLDGE